MHQSDEPHVQGSLIKLPLVNLAFAQFWVMLICPKLQLDISIIKRSIEDLISKEYLERDKGKSNTYRYLG
jgi:hypothetical protein